MRTNGRTALLVAGALGLVLAASGCSSTAEAGEVAQSELTTSAAMLPAAGAGYTLIESEGAGIVDPATGEPPAPCRTGELQITSRKQTLTFVNITGHACSLTGHPGVELATGTAFQPAGQAAEATLLAPGDRLQAVVLPAADCDLVRANGYRVSAPDDTTTVLVGSPKQVCAIGNQIGAFRKA